MKDAPAGRWLSFAELETMSPEFDALVARTPEVDGFCCSSDWVVPARAAFSPEAAPLVLATDAGVIAMMRRPFAGVGDWACPLECSWGLASPLIGPEPELLLEVAMAATAGGTRARGVRALALSGLAVGGRAERALTKTARGRFAVHEGPSLGRVVARLDRDPDGFLARRSAKFRANARRARRAALASGVSYQYLAAFADGAEVARVYQRILAIEARSRKADLGGGLAVPEMRRFYQLMLPRLAARKALRVVFATRDGVDLAFVFGGLFATPDGVEYRGLQVSFDDRFAADSPGVLVHLEMIERLCGEGVVTYDLGTDMEYKRRWGEVGLQTRTWVLIAENARGGRRT